MGNLPLRMKIRRDCPLKSDPELTAVHSWAVASIGLEACILSSPEHSRQDDWFLGTGCGSRPCPIPVPFFPEVHEELMKSWLVCLAHRGASRGYVDIPQAESAVACKTPSLGGIVLISHPKPVGWWPFVAKAYSAAGHAASALHATAILRVYQARVFKYTRVVPTRGWSRSCA